MAVPLIYTARKYRLQNVLPICNKRSDFQIQNHKICKTVVNNIRHCHFNVSF